MDDCQKCRKNRKENAKGSDFVFIAFSKRSRWAEKEWHLSLLKQRKIDHAKNDQSFTSFEYKNPNKILKTLKAKISGRAMIQVASTVSSVSYD